MLLLIGANPPVAKPAIDNHIPCRRLRRGSIPRSKHSAASTNAAANTIKDVARMMNLVVSITLGRTRSLLPSDE